MEASVEIAHIPEALKVLDGLRIFVYDLDGVVIDSSKRWQAELGDGEKHKDPRSLSLAIRRWGTSSVRDEVIPSGIATTWALGQSLGANAFVAVTSRTNCFLGDSMQLLREAGAPWLFSGAPLVISRRDPYDWNDVDEIVNVVTSSSTGYKQAVLSYLSSRHTVVGAIDDYADICAMYRERGAGVVVHFYAPHADCSSVTNTAYTDPAFAAPAQDAVSPGEPTMKRKTICLSVTTSSPAPSAAVAAPTAVLIAPASPKPTSSWSAARAGRSDVLGTRPVGSDLVPFPQSLGHLGKGYYVRGTWSKDQLRTAACSKAKRNREPAVWDGATVLHIALREDGASGDVNIAAHRSKSSFDATLVVLP